MTLKKLRLPFTLLTLVALSPFIELTEVPAAAAAPAPKIAVARASKAVTAPVVKAVAPAVRTTAFAHPVPGLSPKVLTMALDAVSTARARGISGRDDLLTVIDYSLPSTQPRLWVLDLAEGKVLYHELVAHGSGSGSNYATRFSNTMESRQTSLGLFLTGGTYEGGNGYSLKLRGLDQGVNDLAEQRYIVMHGAWYVSAEQARQQGRIGRSWGCPAVSAKMARPVIDTIKGGSFIFSYAEQGASILPKYAG
jgi:L,D-transpeptidase-like protein